MFIGLMSGTSVDAVDGVLADFRTDATAPSRSFDTLAFASLPIPVTLRDELLALQAAGPNELERAALATVALTDLYAGVAAQLMAKPGGGSAGTSSATFRIEAIGAHGQTVRHRPELGFTLQLIDGARLAEATGLPVVCDFRSADVAAGGQGAPLVPAFHALAFGHPRKRRAIVNIGGIANVSLVADAVTGFDTGPGNVLMDAWCERHRNEPFDRDGAWAATGTVDAGLLQRMRAERYFARPHPKSTGRDLFTIGWIDRMLGDHRKSSGCEVATADVQATLCELTASTIADACREFGADEVWLCGGGASNPYLVKRMGMLAAPASVASTVALGIDPQAVEATAFAWLAMRRLRGQPGNLPAVTGARGSRVLGAIYTAL